jgi:hypothetical protein
VTRELKVYELIGGSGNVQTISEVGMSTGDRAVCGEWEIGASGLASLLLPPSLMQLDRCSRECIHWPGASRDHTRFFYMTIVCLGVAIATYPRLIGARCRLIGCLLALSIKL